MDDFSRKHLERRLQRDRSATFVYQFWNDRGECLYIGASKSLTSRFSSHQAKRWWHEVRRIEADWYPNRAAALDAEQEAIIEHQPLYNWVFTENGVGNTVDGKVVRRKADVLGENC